MGARRRIVVVAVSAVVGLATGLLSVLLTADRGTPEAPTASSAALEPLARRVLRDWDLRRSRAYADGDVRALTRLYVPGSRTGAADRALLRSYRSRGLRVSGMHTQVLALAVRQQSDARMVLVATDVLVDAVAEDRRHDRWALPRDRPTVRRIVLRREAGEWRVVEAYAVR